MKKLFSLLVVVVFCVSNTIVAFSEEGAKGDFEITSDGEITAYYGGEWVVVPEQVDGVPVIKIGERTFFDLGILDVYLPEGVAVIGKNAFSGCNMMSIEIPSTVSIIGDYAFEDCADLYTVFLGIDESTVIGKEAFYGTGYLIFYVDCDVDLAAMDALLYEAKGDRKYEMVVRHVASDYDEEGNVICSVCGHIEESTIEPLPFEDVPFDSWYYDYVQIAYVNNIINGKSEKIFDPNAGMTCAEAAKIAACINEIFYEPIPEHTVGAWYQPYVDYCYQYGIIEEHVEFDWDKEITRAEMAYIFSHCDPYEEWYTDINDVPITDIPDVYDTTPYAYEILKLYNKGVAVGDENMRFNPDSNIKRSEAAAIVARILEWYLRVELPKG